MEPERDAFLGDLSAVACTAEEDMTVQGDRDEADINVMLKRFNVTGQIRTVNAKPLMGDFSEALDFQGALNRVREAEREFLNLPSELRAQLQNDPARFQGWLSNPENRAEAERLGLIEKVRPVEPIPVRVLKELDELPE